MIAALATSCKTLQKKTKWVWASVSWDEFSDHGNTKKGALLLIQRGFLGVKKRPQIFIFSGKTA
jgi:hypothetical protein